MKEKRLCPRCKKEYASYPALSRKDNKTEICPECGTEEAIAEYINFRFGEVKNECM